MITRRTCLRAALAAGGYAALRRLLRAESPASMPIDLHVDTGTPGTPVPADFTGLGYELSSAARTGLLSRHNDTYVRLVGNLGTEGVLRLGGIVADFTAYAATGTSKHDPKHTVITRANLLELRGFLERTNWTAIWSVNFGAGTLPDAIAEARAVHEVLGPRLLALELGNEVDNYGHGTRPLRTPPYDYRAFRAEYTRWRAAILAAVPGLSFAAPDTADDSGWLEHMAADGHGEAQLLTTHYYRGDQRKATLDQLLTPDTGLEAELGRLHAATRNSRPPWRMCETNSFYGGGRPGISDTLAGALWTLDFMLLLAVNGCAGVNMETGFNQLGFLSSYSPIRNDETGNASVGAPYYGMLAFAQSGIAGGTMHTVHLAPAPVALTAYAASASREGRSSTRTLVLINRGAAKLSIRLHGFQGLATVLQLEGPTITSTAGLRLGLAEVNAQGSWQPADPAPVPTQAGKTMEIAPYSATILRLGS